MIQKLNYQLQLIGNGHKWKLESSNLTSVTKKVFKYKMKWNDEFMQKTNKLAKDFDP